jgi:hypothetical protein
VLGIGLGHSSNASRNAARSRCSGVGYRLASHDSHRMWSARSHTIGLSVRSRLAPQSSHGSWCSTKGCRPSRAWSLVSPSGTLTRYASSDSQHGHPMPDPQTQHLKSPHTSSVSCRSAAYSSTPLRNHGEVIVSEAGAGHPRALVTVGRLDTARAWATGATEAGDVSFERLGDSNAFASSPATQFSTATPVIASPRAVSERKEPALGRPGSRDPVVRPRDARHPTDSATLRLLRRRRRGRVGLALRHVQRHCVVHR